MVERILADIKKGIKEVVGDSRVVKTVNAAKYVDDKFGLPTVQDILKELEKPGRDPRPEFKAATFREGVEKLSDLEPGMMLEGVVTNVANFGAFVDIGVHQDGLVHVSALADKFVKDPHEVVKAGDIVKVKVLEVDLQRQRVALTMRMSDTPVAKKPGHPQPAAGRARTSHPSAAIHARNNSLKDQWPPPLPSCAADVPRPDADRIGSNRINCSHLFRNNRVRARRQVRAPRRRGLIA